MGDLLLLDHHRPRPAALAAQGQRALTLCGGEAEPGRIAAVDGFTLGQTVALTRGGRTRRAVITAFLCPPGEAPRARLMIAPGYAGAGVMTSAGVHQLERIDG